MPYVYCFKVGSEDCFKIGKTKRNPDERKDDVSVGSPRKLSIYRKVEVDDASRLEWYIHKALDLRRAENGEFFLVTPGEIDKAIDDGLSFLKNTSPILSKAEELKKKKPTDQIREPTKTDRSLYEELRNAKRELFFLQQRVLVLESKMKLAIGHDMAIKGIASWRWQESIRFNLALFKEERPELYGQYAMESATRVLRLLR